MTADLVGESPTARLLHEIREALDNRTLWNKNGVLVECHAVDGDECIPANAAYAKQRAWLGALGEALQQSEEHARILNGRWDDARARHERAEAEITRLRRCLKDLLDAVDYDVGPGATADATNHARAALAGETPPTEQP